MSNSNLAKIEDSSESFPNIQHHAEGKDPPKKEDRGPLNKFLRTLRFNKITEVTIEAGHIYADQVPGLEQREGFTVACGICKRLSEEGITPRRIVFVDDYNVEKDGFSLSGYLDFATDCGFVPDNVFWESEMTRHAEALIGKLLEQGQLDNGEGQKLLTVKQGIKLRHSNGRYTCTVLDTAFHLERFRQFGYNITVLPKCSEQNPEQDYADQQRNVRRLLRILGNDQSPLATVFFDQQRNLNIVH